MRGQWRDVAGGVLAPRRRSHAGQPAVQGGMSVVAVVPCPLALGGDRRPHRPRVDGGPGPRARVRAHCASGCRSSGYNRSFRYGTEKQGGLAALLVRPFSTGYIRSDCVHLWHLWQPSTVAMFLGVLEGAMITRFSTAASTFEHGFGPCAALPPTSCRILCSTLLYKRI